MSPRRSVLSLSPVLFALLLIISTGMMNCKGKGGKTTGTTTTANVPEPSATIPDQLAPAATAPALQQNSTADQQVMNDAALDGELEKVKELIGQGADPNDVDQDGRTALMYASFNGHTEIVRLLLDEGAEVDIKDAMGRTALLYASTGPFAETVKLLLDHHAEPNIVDNDEHFSSLMHAAAEGQLEVVKLLLSSGADPALKDIDGETAALFARNKGHTEVAGLIQSAVDSRYGLAALTSPSVEARESTSTATQKVSVGSFSIDVPAGWRGYASAEAEALRRQYLEQSRQIYQHFSGSDDPSKSVDIAGFHIPGGEGSFIIVSFSVPPHSNLIQMLQDQVGDKMNYGIQQGYIQKYLGLVSVDKVPLAGFYTKAIGESGNFEASGGLEHKDLNNTIIQLTLIAPKGWGEKETTTLLEAVLESVALKKE